MLHYNLSMYLGVDIGGTKTLVGCLDEHGVLKEQIKFPTPKKYRDFLEELEQVVVKLSTNDFRAAAVGVPGKVDRVHGRTIAFGHLTWGKVPIESDIERLVRCPTLIENDANLAGLSEAMLLKHKYQRVLYLTISTGIGSGIIDQGKIDPMFEDSEAGHILIEHNGTLKPWESFASGKAIVEQYGKLAADIHDTKSWKHIAHNIAIGIVSLIAFMQPEVIVLGGSVGWYFERFITPLEQELHQYTTPLSPTPPILKAQRPDLAVLYGCYDLARTQYGPASR